MPWKYRFAPGKSSEFSGNRFFITINKRGNDTWAKMGTAFFQSRSKHSLLSCGLLVEVMQFRSGLTQEGKMNIRKTFLTFLYFLKFYFRFFDGPYLDAVASGILIIRPELGAVSLVAALELDLTLPCCAWNMLLIFLISVLIYLLNIEFYVESPNFSWRECSRSIIGESVPENKV